jgi:hypothetical protein
MWCYGKNLVDQYLVFIELQGLQNRMLLFTCVRWPGLGGLSAASTRTVRAALAATLVASSFMVGVSILLIIVPYC